MPKKINNGYTMLCTLIAKGIEFPEVEFQVRKKCKLSDGEWNDVLEMYDNCY